MATTIATFTKRPSEARTYAFDFKNQVEIKANGETLSGSPTVVTSPSGITIGSPTIVTTQVRFQISGGVDGTTYHITCTVTTSGGATLIECGDLEVLSC